MPLKFEAQLSGEKTGGCSGRLFISIKEICGEDSTRTEKDIDMCIYRDSFLRIFIEREGAAERY